MNLFLLQKNLQVSTPDGISWVSLTESVASLNLALQPWHQPSIIWPDTRPWKLYKYEGQISKLTWGGSSRYKTNSSDYRVPLQSSQNFVDVVWIWLKIYCCKMRLEKNTIKGKSTFKFFKMLFILWPQSSNIFKSINQVIF